jgi:hypothetical protein
MAQHVSMLQERAQAFNRLGSHLLTLLEASNVPPDLFNDSSITDQIITISQMASGSYVTSPMLRAAVSLLQATFPVQIPLDSTDIVQMCRAAYDFNDIHNNRSKVTLSGLDLLRDQNSLSHYFPTKKHSAATNKCNVKLRDLLESLRKTSCLQLYDKMLSSLAGRVSNDQACSAILYAVGLSNKIGPLARDVATCAILQPKNAKGLSNALKALGANSSLLGAALCEADCLQGRAVGSLDLVAEAKYRCDLETVRDSVVSVDQNELYNTVLSILSEELGSRVIEFSGLDTYWDRRWQWCVNGSHSTLLDAHIGFKSPEHFPGADRVYRRMFAEALTSEPVSGWDGFTVVSASEKLENGKTRAIFACDTRSYFAFEHFLGPISQAWKGEKVLLDPGIHGHLGIAKLVQSKQGSAGINVMLDYDDFNSQHSTESMKTVIRAACAYVGYPDDLSASLVSSFDNEWIYLRGRLVGRALGTLMSGHRGTTFLNSVLNAAYIRMAVGESAYSRLESLHVGDDVYMSAPSLSAAGSLLAAVKAFGCRMNPSKQSVGSVGAEFLRLGIRKTHAVGYLARCVASCVSGSWVTHTALTPLEALQSAIVSCRGLSNRSQTTAFPALLARSVADITRLPYRLCHDLLAGNVALEGAPVYLSDGVIRNIKITPPPPESLADSIPHQWPTNATNAYLSNAATAIEQYALSASERSVKSAMLVASYNKALTSVLPARLGIRVRSSRPTLPVGSNSATTLLHARPKHGVLSHYPIIALLKSVIPTPLLRELVGMAGGDPTARDIRDEAWGAESRSKLIEGIMSYSDAANLSGRTSAGVIYSTYPVYM